jgi:hypothetical protein
MATAQTNSHAQPGKRLSFKKVDSFDNKVIEPDAAEGKYEVVIAKVTPRVSKDGWPQLKVSVKLNHADDQDNEECTKSEGATLDDYWTFKSEGGNRAMNFIKRKIRSAAEACEVDIDELPTSIASEEDLKEYVRAFQGKTGTAWVQSEEDRSTGEMQARIHFSEPKAPNKRVSDDDADAEEGTETRGSKTKASKGRAARR